MGRIARYAISIFPLVLSCTHPPRSESPIYDVVIRGGSIYDGLGGAPFVGDVGIIGDRIRVTGNLDALNAKNVIDARAWPSRRDSSTCSVGQMNP